MVSVRALSHSFDGREVLHDIDLEVAPGEIVVIMGSSGGGKTTLLRCISGLIQPTKGHVSVAGIDVHDNADEARRHMGIVFQSAALFDSLTVQENVAFGAQRHGRLSVAATKQLVQKLLDEVGLEGSDSKLPSELSGGMRKRVGLARALALQPEVLLFDEPTSGLDPVTAFSIDQLITETRDRTGAACIVVSHDLNSVIRVADRIVFLHEGKVVFEGTPKEFQESNVQPVRDLIAKAEAVKL